ncbi:hypothetical protein C8J57DRAFT_1407073 [Mycena rebaudengoi]|nr:hypothetical protein C8J57DRAFT_1407073 [Mycena rebaudengoi]
MAIKFLFTNTCSTRSRCTMRSLIISTLLSLSVLILADKNITIDDTDSSIQYSGSGGHALPCIVDADGNLQGGQRGCFYNGPKSCSSGAHILQQQNSTASMKFKGSAIYVNALLDDISSTYIIDVDGKQTEVDGVRPSRPLFCYTLFSQSNLDPAVEHTIKISIKGLSPARNTTLGNDDNFFFWLDNFIVTTPDTGSDSASGSGTPTSSGPSGNPTGAAVSLTSYSHMVSIGAIAVPLLILLSI